MSAIDFQFKDNPTGQRVFTIFVAGLEVYLPIPDARALWHYLNQHKQDLRPEKDWDRCPYEGHANDCDCRGMGGDR
jgi:hypothetical protein